MQKLSVYFNNPRRLLYGLLLVSCRLWPTKLYLSLLYQLRFKNKLNWCNPITFNEKMNWLKCYYHKPEFTVLADKYEVKQIVKDLIGGEYVVGNYGVYDNWEDIHFGELPDQFVIKCTHDSGGAFVCRHKNVFDFKRTRNLVKKNLRKNYYYHLREWPYKSITPRIIVDQYLDDHTGNELRDYKFWCFNGQPLYMYCTIKGDNVYENFYDMDFNPVGIDHGFPRHQPEFEKPYAFELMKKLAEKLCQGIPFVRVDFFQVDKQVYFGEYTFYDWAGLRPFGGDWDEKLGDLLHLPKGGHAV